MNLFLFPINWSFVWDIEFFSISSSDKIEKKRIDLTNLNNWLTEIGNQIMNWNLNFNCFQWLFLMFRFWFSFSSNLIFFFCFFDLEGIFFWKSIEIENLKLLFCMKLLIFNFFLFWKFYSLLFFVFDISVFNYLFIYFFNSFH